MSSACQQLEEKPEVMQPPSVDELVGNWNSIWNANNVDSISNLFAEDALLLTGKEAISSKSSIKNNWITNNAPVMNELKTSILSQGSSDKLIYASGTYEHNVNLPDTLIHGVVGNFTFVRSPDTSGQYLLDLVHIESIK